MTKETLNSFKDKLFWWLLGLSVAFGTWLVISVTDLQGGQKVIQTDDKNRNELLVEMKAIIKENNVILTTKADQEKNELDHAKIIFKLNALETIVEKAYVKIRSFSYNINYDTTIQYVLYDTIIPGKSVTFLNTNN